MKFLDHDEVNARVGRRSVVQRWRDIKADRFPPPVSPGRGGSRNAWVDREIASYQRWRIALRDGETEITRWSEWWALDRPVGDARRPESTESLNPA